MKQSLFGVLRTGVGQGQRDTDKASGFSVLGPATLEQHSVCNLCQSTPPFLRYEVLVSDGDAVRGRCCLGCLPKLLREHCQR
jgi:hypothetical protein